MPRIAIAIAVALSGCVAYEPATLAVCTGDCAKSRDDANSSGDTRAGEPTAGEPSTTDAFAGDGFAGDAWGDAGDGLAIQDGMPLNPCDELANPIGDSPTSAESLDLSVGTASMSRSVCLDDLDYFAFDVVAGEQVTVQIRWTETGHSLAWRLTTCTEPPVPVSACAGETTPRGLTGCSLLAPFTDPLCVEVSAPGVAHADEINYTLEVATDPVCAGDVSEPHDSESWPFQLSGAPPLSTDGTTCPSDDDWYRFSTRGDESVLAIELAISTPLDGHLVLSNCQGALLDSENGACRALDRGGNDWVEQCSRWFESAPATTCFGVMPLAGAPASGLPYVVEVNDSLPCGVDSAESNDVSAHATTFEPGTTSQTPFHLCAVDRDWFWYPGQTWEQPIGVDIIYPDEPIYSIAGPTVDFRFSGGGTQWCPGTVLADGALTGYSRKMCGATIPAGESVFVLIAPNPGDPPDLDIDYYVEIFDF